MISDIIVTTFGNFDFTFLEQAGNQFGVMDNLEIATELRILILKGVVAVRTSRNYFFNV